MTNREAYENMCDELEQYRKIGTVKECRESREKQMPTAFDKEKVIEQIKVLSAGIILNTNICDDYAEGYVRAAKDIIKIVEKGGIE